MRIKAIQSYIDKHSPAERRVAAIFRLFAIPNRGHHDGPVTVNKRSLMDIAIPLGI